MRYKIVQAIREEGEGAEFFVTEATPENLSAVMSARGAEISGQVDAHNLNGRPRRIPLRDELHGQPIFTGFYGPMYDGPGLVRYEDSTANDILST